MTRDSLSLYTLVMSWPWHCHGTCHSVMNLWDGVTCHTSSLKMCLYRWQDRTVGKCYHHYRWSTLLQNDVDDLIHESRYAHWHVTVTNVYGIPVTWWGDPVPTIQTRHQSCSLRVETVESSSSSWHFFKDCVSPLFLSSFIVFCPLLWVLFDYLNV